jgi:GT2 family glycosyltransferase
MDLSIIILMHNRVQMTCRCLEALHEAVSTVDHEIIVVDNSSTEDAGPLNDFLARSRNTKVVRNQVNLTYAIANNHAARIASGNCLLFLNNDVIVRSNSVLRLLSALRSDPKAGIVGGKLLFTGETSVQHAGIRHMLWGYPSNYGVGANPDDPRVSTSSERFALTGAMFCLPRAVFQKVHGFEERYRWGFEDVDLCLKIRDLDKGVLYIHDSISIHEESATLKAVRSPMDVEHNYRLYRATWDKRLVPPEQQYLHNLRKSGIQRVVVFGTGLAAKGLAQILMESGVQIPAFTSTYALDEEASYLGIPVTPLGMLHKISFDRLMLGTQFFNVQEQVAQYDPLGSPLFPVLL